MNNENLISVIVPVYGVEKYIRQCLDSLINQSYRNLEIIVINDGTKDNSAEIAKEYSRKDPRVLVFDYENGGLSVARNRGLTHARGEYIAFLDSDDWVKLDMYEQLLKVLLETKADMVKCGINETDGIKSVVTTFPKNDVVKADFTFYYGGFLHTVVWNALYTRELAMKVQYPVNVVNEDNYATGMYIYYAKKIAFVKEVYSFYRVNLTGISKGLKKRPLDKFRAVNKLKQDLDQYSYKERRLNEILAKEIFHYLRDNNSLTRVIAIDCKFCDWIKSQLDLRRKILFTYLLKKKGIKIYSKDYNSKN